MALEEPGMAMARVPARDHRRSRRLFLEQLARCGDAAIAAERSQMSLLKLSRIRESEPAFASEWQRALNCAWDRVDARVLAALLGDADGDMSAPTIGSGPGQIDIRVALAILARREKSGPVVLEQQRPVDGEAVARLRAELRSLAGAIDPTK
jgi:hypothetical protein